MDSPEQLSKRLDNVKRNLTTAELNSRKRVMRLERTFLAQKSTFESVENKLLLVRHAFLESCQQVPSTRDLTAEIDDILEQLMHLKLQEADVFTESMSNVEMMFSEHALSLKETLEVFTAICGTRLNAETQKKPL